MINAGNYYHLIVALMMVFHNKSLFLRLYFFVHDTFLHLPNNHLILEIWYTLSTLASPVSFGEKIIAISKRRKDATTLIKTHLAYD